VLGHRQEFDVREPHALDVKQRAVRPARGNCHDSLPFFSARNRREPHKRSFASASALRFAGAVAIQAPSFHLNWRVSQTMAAFFGGTSKKNPQGSVFSRKIFRAHREFSNCNARRRRRPEWKISPDAGRPEQAQGMKPSVPLVEIANRR